MWFWNIIYKANFCFQKKNDGNSKKQDFYVQANTYQNLTCTFFDLAIPFLRLYPSMQRGRYKDIYHRPCLQEQDQKLPTYQDCTNRRLVNQVIIQRNIIQLLKRMSLLRTEKKCGIFIDCGYSANEKEYTFFKKKDGKFISIISQSKKRSIYSFFPLCLETSRFFAH